jgi:hypothetical protein
MPRKVELVDQNIDHLTEGFAFTVDDFAPLEAFDRFR